LARCFCRFVDTARVERGKSNWPPHPGEHGRECCPGGGAAIRRADRYAAFLEAVELAGFGEEEARTRFLERFKSLAPR
jgi:hypothetical protein